MARNPAHTIKSPTPKNRAVVNPGTTQAVTPVNVPQPPPTTPNPQTTSPNVATTMANFSDEGATVRMVQSQPATPVESATVPVQEKNVPQYVYVTTAPLVAVGNPNL